jgi:hypothetical protein
MAEWSPPPRENLEPQMPAGALKQSSVRMWRFAGGSAMLIGLLVVLVGCGPGKPLGAVRGTVHFRGNPVTKGVVMLYSPELGYGNQKEIKPDGTYFIGNLPYGPFRIAVQPPSVLDDFGGKSLPTMRVIEVDNIPERYRNPSTSGFSCDITGPRTTVDLRME